MFTLRRKTTEPGSPIHIMVSLPADGDAGLADGGSFHFYPAGSEEGPTSHAVSAHAAKAIMEDHDVAKHFDCSPPWGQAVAEEHQPDHAGGPQERPRRRAKGQDVATDESAT